ncbi:GHKL domain-containing protein [Metaclostridioides mangenotii]|uniref:GHKL domain-containing protein n=1 Tax=Metaclostridioides mangenotii TaxID=1540 RepID=UPI0026F28782|nr:GHKL domain-containing protein [Clostridioides mangenotii]
MQKVSISIPIIANITSILVVFNFIFKDRNITRSEGIEIFLISTIILLSNISLIYIMTTIIKNNNLKLENKTIKEKIEMQYDHYLNAQEDQLKIRRLYHDLKNHIIYIKSVYGDNEKANEYVDTLQKQIDDIKLPFNTNNMALDVILNDKKKGCEKNDINLFIDVDFTKCNFIEIIDIIIIFLNILDNAIEACEKIIETNIEKKINLKGKIVGNFYIIKCENPKVNEINFDNTMIKTDKKDSFLHGIGLNSVKLAVEKYGGNVEINVSREKFEIIILIPV